MVPAIEPRTPASWHDGHVAGGGRRLEEAAVARGPPGKDRHQLAEKTDDAGVHERRSEPDRGIVQQELRREAVGRVDDAIGGAEERVGVARIDASLPRLDRGRGVARRERGRRRVHLGAAEVGGAVEELAMEIRKLDHVGIDEPKASDSGARQCLRGRAAERADADDRDRSRRAAAACPRRPRAAAPRSRQ